MSLALCLWLLSIGLAFLLPSISQIVRWDQSVVAYFAVVRSQDGIGFFKFLSDIGDTPAFLLVLLGVTLYFFLKKRFAAGSYFLVAMGSLKLSVSLLKWLIARPRPPDGVLSLFTYSMPSGHAANAVFISGLLAWMVGQSRLRLWKKSIIYIFCGLFVIGVDLSRVYLGVHYPSDVLVGTLYTASGIRWLIAWQRDLIKG